MPWWKMILETLVQIAFDVVEKLHVQGLVQPVLGVGAGDHLRRGLFRQKGAARDRVHQQEGDTHDEQQRQKRHHDALYDISCHSDPSQRLLIEGSAAPPGSGGHRENCPADASLIY